MAAEAATHGFEAVGLSGEFVERPRLNRRIADARTPVILLNAPSGYGKSVLLKQWGETDPRPFVSILLGEHYDDPSLLLAAIVDALDSVEPLPAEVKSALSAPEPGVENVVLPRLIEALAARDTPMVLVLDELEHIKSPRSLAAIAAIGSNLPSGTQLALATRLEPELPIGKLRAHRHLTEFGRNDLLMSKAESQTLLTNLGLEPTPDQLDVVIRRTEGWPVALYLAGLALSDEDDLAFAVEQFAGDDRIVVDYIEEEFLATLTSSRLKFLRRASVLDRMNGDLCDATMEAPGSGALLKALSRSNLLLVPLDRRDEWFRFHPLLRQMLRSDLRRAEPGKEAALNARASAWWAEHGDWDRAIQHAIDAGSPSRAGELLWTAVPDYMSRGRNGTVVGWIETLGDRAVASDFPLSLTAAYAHLTRGKGVIADHWVSVAELALDASEEDEETKAGFAVGLDLVKATLARDGVEDMGARAAVASRSLPDDSPWHSLSSLLEGVSLHLLGNPDEAQPFLADGARRGAVLAPSVQALCLAQAALIEVERDDWHRAESLIEQGREQVNLSGLIETPLVSLVLAVSAEVRARSGRLEKATEDLLLGIGLMEQFDEFAPWYEVEVRIVLARAAIRVGRTSLASDLLDEATRVLPLTADTAALGGWLEETNRVITDTSTADAGNLTRAEMRVLQFLPGHLSFSQIAAEIIVSPNTVRSQAQSVYRKLDVQSRAEAVTRAQELGLLN